MINLPHGKVVQRPENSAGKYFVLNAAARNWMHGSDLEKTCQCATGTEVVVAVVVVV